MDADKTTCKVDYVMAANASEINPAFLIIIIRTSVRFLEDVFTEEIDLIYNS